MHTRGSFVSLHKKISFSIKDFFSKCDQIRSFLSHLQKKSLMENFTICAVFVSLDDLDNISILLEEYKDLEGKNLI